MINDVLLLEKLSTGDRNAYNELFDRYFDRLHIFASNMVYRDDVAADIIQDVLIKLYEKPVTFASMGAIQSYLFTAIRNRCYNYLRDHKVENRSMLLYVEAVASSDHFNAMGSEDELAEINIDDVLKNVEQIIELLPEKCCEICRMRIIEQRKCADIAQQLNISTNTVRVQIHRGMERIRQHFAKANVIILLLSLSLFK